MIKNSNKYNWILFVFFLILSILDSEAQSHKYPDSISYKTIGISTDLPFAVLSENQYYGSSYSGTRYIAVSYKYGNVAHKKRFILSYQQLYFEALIQPITYSIQLDSIVNQNGKVYKTTDTSQVNVSRLGSSDNLTARFSLEWIYWKNKYSNLYYGVDIAFGATHVWRENFESYTEFKGDTLDRISLGHKRVDAIMLNTNIGFFLGSEISLSDNFILDFKTGVEYLFFFNDKVDQYVSSHDIARGNVGNGFNKFNFLSNMSLAYKF